MPSVTDWIIISLTAVNLALLLIVLLRRQKFDFRNAFSE